eukprot:TRINITY_DN11653_c0_g1_i1.p1 TRINITY_DN11653_c0_g1~~TRINITY_DN11653_c0_g1_i1.p1  ORF type:complete len:262 (-),score=50.18 TRINITY_DN11653_c0_g1_i1:42-806(-)
MARNSEKAQNLLNRYVRGKEEAARRPVIKRPSHTADCRSVVDAEKWRMQIMREIGKGVSEIQNSALGEYKTRELNDNINKLMREKRHWEKKILELGGKNYLRSAPKTVEEDGSVTYGGYQYFGEAKNLPGVKEMLAKPKLSTAKRSRADLYKGVDADYYGYRDDEDGVLEESEAKAEALIKKRAITALENTLQQQQQMKHRQQQQQDEDDAAAVAAAAAEHDFISHVPLPTKEELDRAILAKRKEELLSRYVPV